MLHRFAIFVMMLTIASPAVGRSTAQVPEASNMTLFALGVLGVIVGRQLSMRKSDPDE